MSSVNKAILVGNLGKDPEVRSVGNGDKVVSFSLATSESWKDKQSGERKERSEWHNIVCWNEHIGKVAEQYLKKGSKVYIEGQIQTRKWQDQSGNDRFTTEIVIPRFRGELQILSGSKERDQSSGGSERSYDDGGTDRKTVSTQQRVAPIDDDIPF